MNRRKGQPVARDDEFGPGPEPGTGTGGSANPSGPSPGGANRPRTGRSRREIFVLVGVGLAGGGGLVRLAWDLLTPKLHPNTGIHMRLEVASIWLHPALYDLAQDPSQAAACQSLKELRRYAKERGLEKCFYIITSRSIETSGDVEMLPTIREPCSMTDDTFSEFVNVMAAAAGRPPPYANTDFSTAKVGVIPDRLRRADPHEVLDELNVREQLPNQEAKEKTGIALRKAIVR